MNDNYYIAMGVDPNNRILWYAADQTVIYLRNGTYEKVYTKKDISTVDISKALALSKSEARQLVTRNLEKNWLAYSCIYIDRKIIPVVMSRSVSSGFGLSWNYSGKRKQRHRNESSLAEEIKADKE